MHNNRIGRKIFKENVINLYIVYTSISLWSKFEASVQTSVDCQLPEYQWDNLLKSKAEIIAYHSKEEYYLNKILVAYQGRKYKD